jgi:hypothetical protein
MQARILAGFSSAIVAVVFALCCSVAGAETRAITLARYLTVNPYEGTEYGGEPYV